MQNIVLIGDSIIDNDVYVASGEKPVTEHLKDLLPDWNIEKRALDGAVCSHVINSQFNDSVPNNALVVVSIGGNDALRYQSLLMDSASMTFGEAMIRFREIREEFRSEYERVLDLAVAAAERVLPFTIYNPRFNMDGLSDDIQFSAEGALSAFNDVILSAGLLHKARVLDLRIICDSDSDFANAIEPSGAGGQKIAEAVAQWATSEAY